MTPVLGDKVLFTFDKARRIQIEDHSSSVLDELGQGETIPATVVAVWDETCVNLRVHPDGPGPDLWERSVALQDENVGDGSCWAWPATI